MKELKILSFCCIFVFFFMASADEVTLQNGLNGYTGCEDAWVFGAYYNNNNEKSTNYGTEAKMSVFYGNNGSELTREST